MKVISVSEVIRVRAQVLAAPNKLDLIVHPHYPNKQVIAKGREKGSLLSLTTLEKRGDKEIQELPKVQFWS